MASKKKVPFSNVDSLFEAKKFMNKTNKKFLGEKIKIEVETDDTFLPDKKKSSGGEIEGGGDVNAEVLIKKIMRFVLITPLFATALVSFAYIVMKIFPFLVAFIKRIFFLLISGSM